MSAPVTSTAEVIADRYLTSPVSLRSRPFGPVDALDTHAGRAAQVRIVFLSGEWDRSQLAETVARWCGIGTAGVIGVLDFGDHNGHPFLVLPPSLGMPLERWRGMRHPSAVDAARLALGFGRLVEAVSAAGFAADIAEPSDFGVGPGPTPFLELPLLGRPDAPAILRPEVEGQALIARLYTSTVWDADLPGDIGEWVTRAGNNGFRNLAECLDALEVAASAVHGSREAGDPIGVCGVFDQPMVLPRPKPASGAAGLRLRAPSWAARGVPVLLVCALLAQTWMWLRPSHTPTADAARAKSSTTHRAVKPKPPTTAGSTSTPVKRHPHRHVPAPKPPRRHAHRRHRRHRHVVPTPAPPTTVVTPPPVTRTPAPPKKQPIGVAVGGHRMGTTGHGSGTIVLRHPSFPS
jgi:hypothetical protein